MLYTLKHARVKFPHHPLEINMYAQSIFIGSSIRLQTFFRDFHEDRTHQHPQLTIAKLNVYLPQIRWRMSWIGSVDIAQGVPGANLEEHQP